LNPPVAETTEDLDDSETCLKSSIIRAAVFLPGVLAVPVVYDLTSHLSLFCKSPNDYVLLSFTEDVSKLLSSSTFNFKSPIFSF
jgi:hypothetical protein